MGPAIVFAPAGSTAYADPYAVNRAAVTYQTQAWTSPVITPGMAFTQLIPSWTIATPGRSWVQVLVRVAGAGQWSPWLVMARWCDNDPVRFEHPLLHVNLKRDADELWRSIDASEP